ncbi:acyl-CoA thioesterase [Halapricum salinum]|uniref:Acyl-CoA thioesterase n=1 Tax=Halapricum salinum TaxID=1457250 RepID=A0A4D6HDN7_9EURY|nr:thioesterase family protein [Halapricum salinum]QCC51172.1 acyl-CoA thioesterase [Halapricum salinum]
MSFTFETTVDVRYTDFDTYGHVNNAVYATFLEEARVDYLTHVVGEHADITGSGEGLGIVLATLELDFQDSLGPSDSVTVAVRVPQLGTSSFLLEYEVREDGAVLATGETTVVVFDRASRESRPIPDSWRENISEFEQL